MALGAEGCDVAFHLAAHVADWGPMEDFVRGNVDGTRNALEASRRAGVRALRALRDRGRDPRRDAASPCRRDDAPAHRLPGPLLATKAQAEALVRKADGDGIETVVVRPRFVWGAGDATLLPQLTRAARSGRFAWIAGGTHLTSITHVDNVVEGLIAGARRGAGGEAYFVTDGEDVGLP